MIQNCLIWIETWNYDIHKIFHWNITLLNFWFLKLHKFGYQKLVLVNNKRGKPSKRSLSCAPSWVSIQNHETTQRNLKSDSLFFDSLSTTILLLTHFWSLSKSDKSYGYLNVDHERNISNIVQLIVLSFHWKEKEIIRKFPLWKEILVVAKRRWDLWSY